MELRHLRYFIKAAELLHFTRAAESLHVSQPALSVHIQQLEEEFGTELFHRVGRGVRLSEAGKVLLLRARQAMKELEEAGREIDAITGLLSGTLNIASLPLYGSQILTSWITEFNRLYPAVNIKAKAMMSHEIESGVIDGSIDIGLATLPLEHGELSSLELFRDELVLVISSSNPLASKERLSPEDIREQPLAWASERMSSTSSLGRYFEEFGFQPQIQVAYDDGHALVELVKNSKFITFLPRLAVQQQPDIKFLPLPAAAVHVGVGLLWNHLCPASKAFLDLAAREAKRI